MSAIGNDATTALLRALRRTFHGVNFVNFERVQSREWASITFTGARHEITIRLGGPDAEATADRFLQNLDAAEFRLRGHILADIALVTLERTDHGVRLHLEALTVEDG
jgi:hypothetical protein